MTPLLSRIIDLMACVQIAELFGDLYKFSAVEF